MKKKETKAKVSERFDRIVLKYVAAAVVGATPVFFIYQLLDKFSRWILESTALNSHDIYIYIYREGTKSFLYFIGMGFICLSLFAVLVRFVEKIFESKQLITKKDRLKLIWIFLGCGLSFFLIFLSSRSYICLSQTGIVERRIWGNRINYTWGDVNYLQSRCERRDGRRGPNYILALDAWMKNTTVLELWSENMKNIESYSAEGLGKIYQQFQDKKLPLVRGNLKACRDKFLDFALIGPPKVYDQPEIWEVVKEVFVGKANV